MRAGKLDREITIERQTGGGLDDYGKPLKEWQAVATLRAQIIEASTEEFIRAHGASSESVVIFRTRFVAGVTVADRVVYEGAIHEIKETKEIGRRRGLEIRTVARGL